MNPEDQQTFCDQLDGMEKEFKKQGSLLQKVSNELQYARSENSMLQEKAQTLYEENKKLLQLVADSNKLVAERLNHATQNVALQTRIDLLEAQLAQEQEFHEKQVQDMKLTTSMMQKEIDIAKELERSYSRSECSDSESQAFETLLTEKEQLLNELQKEIKFQCQQRNNMEIHFSEQLSSLHKVIVDKNRELQQARQQYSDCVLSHEQQLQKARMKYEEHLLNVVQSGNESQLETSRRKMLSQKQAADNEIATLKKKIMLMENKQHPQQRGRPGYSSKPAATLDFFS